MIPITRKSEVFPKMEVMLYDAPTCPRKLIAFSYLECIEDRRTTSVDQLSYEEATKVTEWVLKGGHTPSLESIHLCFNIRGVSRVFSHQIVRHRIGVSIDQKTQRANSKEYLGKFYTDNHFVLPPSFIKNKFGREIINYFCNAEQIYLKLLEQGISEDDARYIIPQCAETSMNFKVIYKALQHIASVRLCSLMQGEMVECVRLMVECVKEYDGLLGRYLVPNCFNTGVCNRNENNPTDEYPFGVCAHTKNGIVRRRQKDDTFDLTKFSRDTNEYHSKILKT